MTVGVNCTQQTLIGSFDLKAIANMWSKNKLICLLLAVMLAASNLAFSAHVSSHPVSDSSFCSLCIHPGSPDSVLANEPGAVFVSPHVLTSIRKHAPAYFSTRLLQVHHSRAPPNTL